MKQSSKDLGKSYPKVRASSRVFLKVAVLLLAFFMVLTGMGLRSQGKLQAESTSESIEDAKKQKADAEKQLADAQSRVNALKADASEISSNLAYLNNMNKEQKAQYAKISQELEAALVAKQAALDAYLESEDNLAEKRLEYSERMSVMFEYQNKSTLEILLESDSIAGFFTNMELITLIGDADKQAVETLKAAVDDAVLKRDFAKQEAEDMQAVADEKKAELDRLAGQISSAESDLAEKKSELSQWEQKEQEFNAASDALNSRISELQQQAAAEAARRTTENSSGGGNGGSTETIVRTGNMTWPYPGDYNVYSPFGMRFHPVHKEWREHKGVDLGGQYGNPIVAAASGTVIIVSTPVPGQNKGGDNYGNYLVIDHGNGLSTAYAHCKDIYVSVGESVEAGQKIASCGSTGISTGAHLHFEVRENGTQVNPLNYI